MKWTYIVAVIILLTSTRTKIEPCVCVLMCLCGQFKTVTKRKSNGINWIRLKQIDCCVFFTAFSRRKNFGPFIARDKIYLHCNLTNFYLFVIRSVLVLLLLSFFSFCSDFQRISYFSGKTIWFVKNISSNFQWLFSLIRLKKFSVFLCVSILTN